MDWIPGRNRIAILAACGCVAFAIFTFVTALTPLNYGSGGGWLVPAYDFSLRMTEIKCLKSGVNPFDVWHGDKILPPYKPNHMPKVEGPEFTEEINAYAPWEYTFMMPLEALSRTLAWIVYFVLMMVSLIIVFGIGFSFGRAIHGSREEGLIIGAVPLLMVAYPSWSNICIGNFSVIVLAATALMAVCLERGRDVAAGFCWAIAMIKPQLGLAFAIPLLLRRKVLTCAVAALVCGLATIPPSLLCDTSPITLVLQAPAANTFMFHGCGTWPYVLCGLLGGADLLIALAVGAAACFVMIRIMPADINWFVYLMPAAVCSTTWTYASTYGHVMEWFFFFVLAVEIVENPKSRMLRCVFLVSGISATRLYNAWHGFTSAFSGAFPALAIPDVIHWHVDSLVSSLDLLLAFMLCVILCHRHSWKEDPVS